MRLHPRTGLVPVLASLLAGTAFSLPPALADPPPEPIPVGALPDGPAPRVPYLVGLTLHDGRHRVHVPLQVRAPGRHHEHYIALLGPTRGGYVLVDGGDKRATIYVLRHGRLRAVRSVKDAGGESAWLLGTDGQHIMELRAIDDPVVHVFVYDLHHRHVQQTTVTDFTHVLAFDGHTAYFAGDPGYDGDVTTSWDSGHHQTQVWPAAASAVDLARSVLWISSSTPSDVGPTSLAAPASPLWAAPFTPVAISPDGQYVSGFATSGPGALSVRRMSDGAAVRLLSGPSTDSMTLGTWDSDGSVLIDVGSGRRHQIVRCPVVGGCEVAVPVTRDLISFAYQLVSP